MTASADHVARLNETNAMNSKACTPQGVLRVAACTPRIELADPTFNARETLSLMREGHARDVDLMVFPELGLSAYSVEDLMLQDALLDAVEAALFELVEASRELKPVCILGAPVRRNGRLYNCGVAVSGGKILGAVPKSFLPNYREFYEHRWFAPGAGIAGFEVELAGQHLPFGTDLLFAALNQPDFTFHIELCEDFWSATPPSTGGALAGAHVLCNLSASNVVVGKANDRALLCSSQSIRCKSAYVYSAAGPGESTTDLAWDGQATIHQLGVLLTETPRFPTQSQYCIADVDIQRLRLERMRTPIFMSAATTNRTPRFRRVTFSH